MIDGLPHRLELRSGDELIHRVVVNDEDRFCTSCVERKAIVAGARAASERGMLWLWLEKAQDGVVY